MPKVPHEIELERLLGLIPENPAGISIDAIAQRLGDGLQRRTLQRRLALLVAQGQLRMLGAGRSVRYSRLPTAAGVSAPKNPELKDEAANEAYVPTSPGGAEIKAYVRQPRTARPPVGYRLQFLEQYHPNHTTYLPQSLREQLHALGKSPAEQTPAGTFARDILNRLLIDLSWASSQLEGNTYTQPHPCVGNFAPLTCSCIQRLSSATCSASSSTNSLASTLISGSSVAASTSA